MDTKNTAPTRYIVIYVEKKIPNQIKTVDHSTVESIKLALKTFQIAQKTPHRYLPRLHNLQNLASSLPH